MNLNIIRADMRHDPGSGYIGQVEFTADDHPHPYEITLHSEDGKSWSYGLHFARESGRDEDIDAVEQYLEESDEAFDLLVGAATAALKR